MLSLFKRITQRTWKGSTSSYVARFRRQLNAVAKELAEKDGRTMVRTRFNSELKCAELYTSEGKVIAQVTAFRLHHARAIVAVRCNLSIVDETVFSRKLTTKHSVVEFRAL